MKKRGIVRLDKIENKTLKTQGPTEREMIGMRRQHEQAVRELARQIPVAGGKIRHFTFTK